MYPLNSPLLKKNIEYMTITADIIQNTVSSIYVRKLGVLKLLLNILNISNTIPISTPFNIKTRNK